MAAPSRAATPNWDIASTCSVEGRQGLLLVEAKAHDEELLAEISGKGLSKSATEGSVANHGRIAEALTEANEGLNAILPGWGLSHTSHYQMSNRFAWAWKLTRIGFPVILVYLGFTLAVEMCDRGTPFTDAAAWRRLVITHSRGLVPAEAWDRKLKVNDQAALIPLIRAM